MFGKNIFGLLALVGCALSDEIINNTMYIISNAEQPSLSRPGLSPVGFRRANECLPQVCFVLQTCFHFYFSVIYWHFNALTLAFLDPQYRQDHRVSSKWWRRLRVLRNSRHDTPYCKCAWPSYRHQLVFKIFLRSTNESWPTCLTCSGADENTDDNCVTDLAKQFEKTSSKAILIVWVSYNEYYSSLLQSLIQSLPKGH